jgi:hypothetical protein
MKWVWLLSFVALGCADLGRRTAISPGEYDAYRRFRVAGSVPVKLASGFDYVSRYRSGAYRAEVNSWLAPAAQRSVELAWNDAPRLEAFLRAVPSGIEAARASARLVELRLAADYRARHERLFDERIHGIEGRLAKAEAGRRALVADVIAWSRRLSKIHSWGGRTSDLDDEFIFAYRLSEPAARCDDDGCTKTLSVSYDVPEGKMQSPREAIYDVRLAFERGGVTSAWITGPELFSRLGEAMGVSAISPTDFVGRAEAIGQATQLIALAVEGVLPASRCGAEAVSPVVLRRACDGVDLRVISALTPEEEDRVVVSPLPAASTDSPSAPARR